MTVSLQNPTQPLPTEVLTKRRQAEKLIKDNFGVDAKLKTVNPTPFINRKAVKNFLLEHAARTRPANKFKRVSAETLKQMNDVVRVAMQNHVHRHPSVGKTL